MLDRFPLMIPGGHSGGGVLEVVSPYERTPIAEVELADESAIESAFVTAHALFRDRRRWLPADERSP